MKVTPIHVLRVIDLCKRTVLVRVDLAKDADKHEPRLHHAFIILQDADVLPLPVVNISYTIVGIATGRSELLGKPYNKRLMTEGRNTKHVACADAYAGIFKAIQVWNVKVTPVELTLRKAVSVLPDDVRATMRKRGLLQDDNERFISQMSDLHLLLRDMPDNHYTAYVSLLGNLFLPRGMWRLCEWLAPSALLKCKRDEIRALIFATVKDEEASLQDMVAWKPGQFNVTTPLRSARTHEWWVDKVRAILNSSGSQLFNAKLVDEPITEIVEVKDGYYMFARDYSLTNRLVSMLRSMKVTVYTAPSRTTLRDTNFVACQFDDATVVTLFPEREGRHTTLVCARNGLWETEEEARIVVVHQAHRWGVQSLVQLLECKAWSEIVLVGNPWARHGSPIVGDRGTPFQMLCRGKPSWIEFHEVVTAETDESIRLFSDFESHPRVKLNSNPRELPVLVGERTLRKAYETAFPIPEAWKWNAATGYVLIGDVGEVRRIQEPRVLNKVPPNNEPVTRNCLVGTPGITSLTYPNTFLSLHHEDWSTVDHRMCCLTNDPSLMSCGIHTCVCVNVADALRLWKAVHRSVFEEARFHVVRDVTTRADCEAALMLCSGTLHVTGDIDDLAKAWKRYPPSPHVWMNLEETPASEPMEGVVAPKFAVEDAAFFLGMGTNQWFSEAGEYHAQLQAYVGEMDQPAPVEPVLKRRAVNTEIPVFEVVDESVANAFLLRQVMVHCQDRIFALAACLPHERIGTEFDPTELEQMRAFYPQGTDQLELARETYNVDVTMADWERVALYFIIVAAKGTSVETWLPEAEMALFRWRMRRTGFVDESVVKTHGAAITQEFTFREPLDDSMEGTVAEKLLALHSYFVRQTTQQTRAPKVEEEEEEESDE